MSHCDAQSETQSAWTNQDRQDICPSDSPSQEGLGGIGRQSRDLSSGTAGTSGAQAVLVVQVTKTVIGKILTRLVDRAEQRLNEAEECLAWYERQKNQARAELDDLKAMIEELNSAEE